MTHLANHTKLTSGTANALSVKVEQHLQDFGLVVIGRQGSVMPTEGRFAGQVGRIQCTIRKESDSVYSVTNGFPAATSSVGYLHNDTTILPGNSAKVLAGEKLILGSTCVFTVPSNEAVDHLLSDRQRPSKPGQLLTIGRLAACDISISNHHTSVGRLHCLLEANADGSLQIHNGYTPRHATTFSLPSTDKEIVLEKGIKIHLPSSTKIILPDNDSITLP